MTGSGKDHVVYHTREWCRIQGIRQLFVVKCSQLCFGLDAMISIFFFPNIGMFNKDAFSKMKSNAVFVNTSR